MLAIAVVISLRFLPQPPCHWHCQQPSQFLSQAPMRACAPHRIARKIVCNEQSADTAALIAQLREAEAALQVIEREADKSPSTLATKSKLEQSVLMGVAALRESGMTDDQIFTSVMVPNMAASPPPAAAATRAVSEEPYCDRPISKGVTNGVILVRDPSDGSIRPFALIHGLKIEAPSTGEGTAACVCMLNAPESHAPGGFCIQASVEGLRQVTQAMFVHVEESAVLGMLHDATDGAYGEAATTPAAMSLPSYFQQ